MESLEAQVKRLNERVEEMHAEQAAMMAERTERSTKSLAQIEAHRVMLAEAHAAAEEAQKGTDALWGPLLEGVVSTQRFISL